MSDSDLKERLRKYMAAHRLKGSKQRDTIVTVFLASKGHISVDELLERARKVDVRISQATVYRTIRLLCECGIAKARQFGEGQTRYEVNDSEGEHHDHLICTECDTIIEFVDDRIERLQEKVAKEHGFRVLRHRMELYGVCPDCAKGR